MPDIALSPKAFANLFTRGFAGAARDAAGRDGRLSKSEAGKMVEPYRDNALNYLEKTGQASVSLEKVIGAAHDYAYATSEKAAGPDGRISLKDAEKLPLDLQADYLKARGRLPPAMDSKRLLDLAQAAARANAGDGPDTVLPSFDSGEDGTYLYALSPAQGKKVMEIYDRMRSDASGFDPNKHDVAVFRSTFDEEDLYPILIDKQTGAAKVLGYCMMVDVGYEDEAWLNTLVPNGAEVAQDHMAMIDALVKGAPVRDLDG